MATENVFGNNGLNRKNSWNTPGGSKEPLGPRVRRNWVKFRNTITAGMFTALACGKFQIPLTAWIISKLPDVASDKLHAAVGLNLTAFASDYAFVGASLIITGVSYVLTKIFFKLCE